MSYIRRSFIPLIHKFSDIIKIEKKKEKKRSEQVIKLFKILKIFSSKEDRLSVSLTKETSLVSLVWPSMLLAGHASLLLRQAKCYEICLTLTHLWVKCQWPLTMLLQWNTYVLRSNRSSNNVMNFKSVLACNLI